MACVKFHTVYSLYKTSSQVQNRPEVVNWALTYTRLVYTHAKDDLDSVVGYKAEHDRAFLREVKVVQDVALRPVYTTLSVHIQCALMRIIYVHT